MNHADDALLRLIDALRLRGYAFVTPTPATHARVLARPDRQVAGDLRDVLGWSLPFAPADMDADILALLERADAVESAGAGLLRSKLRVSTLRGDHYIHSAYPTEAADSVFFGPDSYRFAELIAAELERRPAKQDACIVDIGTGAGVGAMVAARCSPSARVSMTEINPAALRLARLNARAAGMEITAVEGEGLDDVEGAIDLALANPPYIIDPSDRTYRDGGEMLGGQVSHDMAALALPRLAPGGRMMLYTGSAIVQGEDALRNALNALAGEHCSSLAYREIDPDVFGEELEQPAYAGVERIALVAAIFTRS